MQLRPFEERVMCSRATQVAIRPLHDPVRVCRLVPSDALVLRREHTSCCFVCAVVGPRGAIAGAACTSERGRRERMVTGCVCIATAPNKRLVVARGRCGCVCLESYFSRGFASFWQRTSCSVVTMMAAWIRDVYGAIGLVDVEENARPTMKVRASVRSDAIPSRLFTCE